LACYLVQSLPQAAPRFRPSHFKAVCNCCLKSPAKFRKFKAGKSALVKAPLCHPPIGIGNGFPYIQEWLAHSSSKTTEIYTHATTKNLQQIRLPFDDV
jgi:integrase